jgi:hypothetical protein
VLSGGGRAAQLISKYRPPCPILVVSDNEQVLRGLAGYYGITPCKVRLQLLMKKTVSLIECVLLLCQSPYNTKCLQALRAAGTSSCVCCAVCAAAACRVLSGALWRCTSSVLPGCCYLQVESLSRDPDAAVQYGVRCALEQVRRRAACATHAGKCYCCLQCPQLSVLHDTKIGVRFL